MGQSIKYSVLLFLDQKLVIAERVILDMEKADSPYRVDESSLVDVPELDFSDILITWKGQLTNSSQTWLDYKLYF